VNGVVARQGMGLVGGQLLGVLERGQRKNRLASPRRAQRLQDRAMTVRESGKIMGAVTEPPLPDSPKTFTSFASPPKAVMLRWTS
jgi:hypothetical protein